MLPEPHHAQRSFAYFRMPNKNQAIDFYFYIYLFLIEWKNTNKLQTKS